MARKSWLTVQATEFNVIFGMASLFLTLTCIAALGSLLFKYNVL